MKRASSLAFVLLLAGCGPGVEEPADGGPDASSVPVDAGPTLLEVFVTIGSTTEGIAIGRTPPGAPVMYVSTGDDRIVQIAPDGVMQDFASLRDPLGIAIRSDGSLVVCGKAADLTPGLFAVSSDGAVSPLVVAAPDGSPLGQPNFVAIAPDGSLVFSDSMADRVYRADADGAGIAIVAEGIAHANGLAFSPDGTALHVAEWAASTVHRLDFDASAGTYGPAESEIEGVASVDGIVTTDTGALVLVTSGDGVLLVDPASPSAPPEELLAPNAILLPANGVLGDSAFGLGELYLTSLGRPTVFVLHTNLRAP